RKAYLAPARQKLIKKYQNVAIENDMFKIEEFKTQIEQARQQEKDLEGEIKRWQNEAETYRTGGPKLPPEVALVSDQLRVLEREHERLSAELADLRTRQKTADPRVTIKRKAFVPTEKEYSRPVKFALAAGVGVFGLVLVGLCLVESRNR